MFLVVRNAGHQEGHSHQGCCHRICKGGKGGCRHQEHEDTGTDTVNHAHKNEGGRVEIVTFADFQMNGIGERSTGTHLSKTVLDFLPVLPDGRIGVIVDFTLQGCKLSIVCTTSLERFHTDLGMLDILTHVDEIVRIRKSRNAHATAVQVLNVAAHYGNPVIAFALLHTGAVGKVDVEQQAEGAKGVKHRNEHTHVAVTLPDEHANHDQKAIKDQEHEELRKCRIAHETHLCGELDSETFHRLVICSIEGIDAVGIVHVANLVRQVLRHLVSTVTHMREREELVAHAGTTVEGTANHAFGAILLTFDEVIEGDPVFVLEQVTELQVPLLVADVDFRIVFVDNRVQFRTDRNVEVRAVTDQGEERKCQRKTHAALHALALERLRKAKDRKGYQADERNFDKSGHHVNDGAKKRTRNPDRNAFHNLLGFRHEQECKHGWHRKHGVKMSAHAEERDITNENQDAVAVLFITLVVPDEAKVRNKHQYKHGDAVDFGFDSVEPEGVGKSQ